MAEDVQIGPNVVVGPNAVIESGMYLYSFRVYQIYDMFFRSKINGSGEF